MPSSSCNAVLWYILAAIAPLHTTMVGTTMVGTTMVGTTMVDTTMVHYYGRHYYGRYIRYKQDSVLPDCLLCY
jgi:hypothetical protein